LLKERLKPYLCSPLQPELEDIVVSAALDDFVAGVILNVIEFVLHEQILCAHLVAADQQALWCTKT